MEGNRGKGKGNCIACELLFEIYEQAEKTNRNYWIMTELFVMLHDGKDECLIGNNRQNTELAKIIDERKANFEIADE